MPAFAAIPFRALADPDMTERRLRALLAIGAYVPARPEGDGTRATWASVTTLAAAAKLDPRHFREALAALIARGYVRREDRPGKPSRLVLVPDPQAPAESTPDAPLTESVSATPDRNSQGPKRSPLTESVRGQPRKPLTDSVTPPTTPDRKSQPTPDRFGEGTPDRFGQPKEVVQGSTKSEDQQRSAPAVPARPVADLGTAPPSAPTPAPAVAHAAEMGPHPMWYLMHREWESRVGPVDVGRFRKAFRPLCESAAGRPTPYPLLQLLDAFRWYVAIRRGTRQWEFVKPEPFVAGIVEHIRIAGLSQDAKMGLLPMPAERRAA